MKYLKLFILGAIALAAVESCKTEFDLLMESNDSPAMYAMAFDLFNQGKYYKSAQMFEALSMLTAGTAKDDTVQYYWGLSNYRYKDYYTAQSNFDKFLENYPLSPFAEDARFLRLDCMYRSTYRYELDQKPTQTAMIAIGEFIKAYPDSPHMDGCLNMMKDLSERLDRKAFEAARLYYNMEDYLAARVSLRNVLKEDAENVYREDILYYTAMSSYKYAFLSVAEKQKERYLEFVDDYLNFVGEYPESSYRKELDNLYHKSQKALGREVDVEEE